MHIPYRAVALLLACALQAAPARAQVAVDTLEHRIDLGDTLIGLHARLMRPDADWRVVQRLNRIADPHRLRPGTTLRIPVSMLREQPASAEVLHVHGEVLLERPGAASTPLHATDPLRSGDLVTTGAQSSVSVRFDDGSHLLLGPFGRLRVQRHVRLGASGVLGTQLRLEAGGMETHVQPAQPAPRFELRTPVASLGVRGTDFRARLDGQRLFAEVLHGRVAVAAQPVDAGFGTVAALGRVATPRALVAAPDVSRLPTLVQKLPLQFSLPPAAGARRYRAQLFDTAEPESLLLDGLFDAPQITWPDTPPDGRYALRVRVADDAGIEGHTAERLFTLKARPEPPFQLRPRAGERLTDAAVAFAWARHPQADHYRLQVAAQPDFSAPVVDRDDITGTETTATLPVGNWYWRLATVRSGSDAGPWGDASELQRIEPPPPPAAPAAEPPQTTDAGLVMRWAAVPLPDVSYQVQVARDAAFTQLVVDQTTAATELVLPRPEPGAYYLRVRAVAGDGRAGAFGAAQVVEVPNSRWWLWLLLPLLLLV